MDPELIIYLFNIKYQNTLLFLFFLFFIFIFFWGGEEGVEVAITEEVAACFSLIICKKPTQNLQLKNVIFYHFYQAAVAINTSNLRICFFSFDLSCPILDKI